MNILIAGGGIGGLSAALCCLHFGHKVTVLEQANYLGEVGAGIQLPPNAMKIFMALGLEEKIAVNAFSPEAIETRMGESGTTIFTIPLGNAAQIRWGAPYLHIHRGDYITALKEALMAKAPNCIKLGAALISYTQNEGGVTALLANGETVGGDVLIGADGIHSTTRAQMLGPDAPSFTGNVAWRAVVPIEKLGDNAPSPTACAWMGKGRHAVTYRLRRGTLANFVGVVERDDWTEESWNTKGRKEDALKDFANWHPSITQLIEDVDESALFRWALFERPPLNRWVDGRVALLGDAAHPMLPFLAQGAAMAVEDAWALAAELSASDQNVPAALKTYQARRLARTAAVQASSRANAKTFHKRTFTSQFATYGPMWLAGKMVPTIVHRRMDWLYGYDETRK